jgi:hypothetical protein
MCGSRYGLAVRFLANRSQFQSSICDMEIIETKHPPRNTEQGTEIENLTYFAAESDSKRCGRVRRSDLGRWKPRFLLEGRKEKKHVVEGGRGLAKKHKRREGRPEVRARAQDACKSSSCRMIACSLFFGHGSEEELTATFLLPVFVPKK